MNINFENTIRKNLPKDIIQPRRAMIYVGFQCHQKCGFCYYKYKCNETMFDFDIVKKQIDFEYAYGIREFEITGGEPSEYDQLRQTCQYIKNKDSNTKIAIITNGGLWKSNVWDLIDEVLVSYHLGRNVEYDHTIFPLGCTYDKVKKTIDIAHELRKTVRTNTVCATFNLNQIDKTVDDIIEFKPNIINFLPVNLFDQAKDNMQQYIDYVKFRPLIKQQIDKINNRLKCEINIRYMPFCDMEGYTQYIKGQLQHIYDKYDWNRELDGIKILELIKQSKQNLTLLGRYGSTSINVALQLRQNFYTKSEKCLLCKYNVICDGVEKTKNNTLHKYIIPVIAPYILNII